LLNLDIKILKYILSRVIFGMTLVAFAGCTATIFRLPAINDSSKNEFATIVIPNNIIIERIDAFRFGHCLRNETKKCAVQLSPGDYVLTASHVTSATSIRTIIAFSNSGAYSSTNVNPINHSSSNKSKISVTLKNNEYYTLLSLSSSDPIGLYKYEGKRLDDIKNDFTKSDYITLKRDPVRVLDYVVE